MKEVLSTEIIRKRMTHYCRSDQTNKILFMQYCVEQQKTVYDFWGERIFSYFTHLEVDLISAFCSIKLQENKLFSLGELALYLFPKTNSEIIIYKTFTRHHFDEKSFNELDDIRKKEVIAFLSFLPLERSKALGKIYTHIFAKVQTSKKNCVNQLLKEKKYGR